MKKIYKILVSILVLLSIMQIAYATEEKEYICVDRVTTESPPPVPSFIKTDTGLVAKAPLCSEGKVPKAVVGVSKDTAGYDVVDIRVKDGETKTATCGGNKCWNFAASRQVVADKGVSAYLTQHSPSIDPSNGIYSAAGISLGDDNGGSWLQNYVGVGWRKDKGGITRLNTEHKIDGVTQCPNGCGWVQYSAYYYPGMSIISTDYGVSYLVQYYNGNWWISWNGQWLGYYPGSLWGGNFDQGNYATYQGIVVTSIPTTRTAMGNGLWALNAGAAKIYGQRYMSAYNDNWYDANTYKYATTPSLYSVLSTGSNSMRYGGPGRGGMISGITVISPNGGESWKRGATKTIRWNSAGNVGPRVKIELYKGGVLKRVIASSTPNDGSHSWYVPYIQTGNNYKIKISTPSYNDLSNNYFRIY